MKKLRILLLLTVLAATTSFMANGQGGCPMPTGLTSANLAEYTADLGWSGTASTYQLRYRAVGTTTWTFATTADTFLTVSNLTCSTNYEWQVRGDCDPGATVSYSPWVQPVTFATATCAVACPIPTNLTTSNVGLLGATFSWIPTAPSPVSYQVRYAVAGSGNWSFVNTSSGSVQVTGLNCGENYEWQIRSDCGGAGYSAWSSVMPFTTSACNSGCPAPSGMTTSNITLISADVDWTVIAPGPTTFQFRYREVGAPTWNIDYNAVSPISLTGLSCGTDYEWQVRADCDITAGKLFSPWSLKITFSTLACNATCPPPINQSETNVGLYDAALNWGTNTPPGTAGFDIRYRPAGGSWTQVDGVTSPYQVSNLTCSSDYEWEVRSVCSPTISPDPTSVWTTTRTFTTNTCSVACPSPVGLSAGNITQSGADLSWIPTAPGSVTYQIRYRESGNPTWSSIINTSSNPYSLSGLSCGITYEWMLRTVCAGPSYSAWSVMTSFSTSACLDMIAGEVRMASDNSGELMLSVYPNPANDHVMVNFTTDGNAVVSIEVRDVLGRVAHTNLSTVSKGQQSVEVNTSVLKPGWYSLTVVSNNQRSSARVLISR